MQKLGNKRETTLIAGKSTYGKSCFADQYLYFYNRVIILDPLLEHDGKYIAIPGLIERHITGNPIYRVKTDCILEFENLCNLIIRHGDARNRITFAIEEITRLDLDARLKRFPKFRQICFAGGHSGIDLCIIAQRISTIPISLRSQYTKIITFNQTEPDDLDYLKSVSQDELIACVPTLPPREYIEITTQTIVRRQS